MTRTWYGSIIHTLWTETKFDIINANFIYVPAVYPKKNNPEYPPNEIVAPVNGFSSLNFSDKPIALIIGLGIDKGRAIGLKESLDPDLTITFYTNPCSDRRYLVKMMKSNEDFLELIPNECRFEYPINDSITTYNILESVCSGLFKNYNIVLTSLGPKIFGLCCFLLSSRFPQISVWRISAGSSSNVIDHKPSKMHVLLETTWALAKE
jgi:hypothetical protein